VAATRTWSVTLSLVMWRLTSRVRISVSMQPRLAPMHPWPQGALDVAGVVEWLRKYGAQYSGDPDRIFLFGQSAGAAHVATYIFHEEFQPKSGAGVAGAILMSVPCNQVRSIRGFRCSLYGPDTGKYGKVLSLISIGCKFLCLLFLPNQSP
jgi:triacylglycerol lipase